MSPDVAARLTEYSSVQMVAERINFLTKSFNLLKIKMNFVYLKTLNLQKKWQNYNSRRLSKVMGVKLARLSASKEYGRSFKVFTSGKFKTSRLKKRILSQFWDQKS